MYIVECYCPICDRTYKVYLADVDSHANCPKCKHHLAIPEEEINGVRNSTKAN